MRVRERGGGLAAYTPRDLETKKKEQSQTIQLTIRSHDSAIPTKVLLTRHSTNRNPFVLVVLPRQCCAAATPAATCLLFANVKRALLIDSEPRGLLCTNICVY